METLAVLLGEPEADAPAETVSVAVRGELLVGEADRAEDGEMFDLVLVADRVPEGDAELVSWALVERVRVREDVGETDDVADVTPDWEADAVVETVADAETLPVLLAEPVTDALADADAVMLREAVPELVFVAIVLVGAADFVREPVALLVAVTFPLSVIEAVLLTVLTDESDAEADDVWVGSDVKLAVADCVVSAVELTVTIEEAEADEVGV